MNRLSNEVITQFKSDFITSNNMGTTLLILLALYNEDYKFLDDLDDSNKDKKMILLYRDLVYKGYLYENEDNEDSSNVHFGLTKKAIDLVNSVEDKPEPKNEAIEIAKSYIDNSKLVEIEEFEEKEEKDVDPFRKWVYDWVNLFPKRRADGYPMRNKGVCVNKMEKFLKIPHHAEYTKDVILKATKLYLQEQEQNGWKYTLLAGNFIYKAEKGRGNVIDSTLATYCDLILNGNEPSEYLEFEDNNPFL